MSRIVDRVSVMRETETESTLQERLQNGKITLEEYALQDGPNVFQSPSVFSGFSFAPSTSYAAADARREYEEFKKTVQIYTQLDAEIDYQINDLARYDTQIKEIMSNRLPSLISRLNVDRSDLEKAATTISRNPEVIRMNQEFKVMQAQRRSYESKIALLQHNSLMLKEQAIESKARITVDHPLATAASIAAKNAKRLGMPTRTHARIARAQAEADQHHAVLKSLTEARDERTTETELNDEFQQAIMAALTAAPQKHTYKTHVRTAEPNIIA